MATGGWLGPTAGADAPGTWSVYNAVAPSSRFDTLVSHHSTVMSITHNTDNSKSFAVSPTIVESGDARRTARSVADELRALSYVAH